MPDPIPPSQDLAGKTVIITGGNTGLGFEVARQTLLLQAARVIITARSPAKGADAVAALQANTEIQSANPAAQIEVFDLDLDDYQSGLRFCQKVKKQVPELDLLLCNGGTTLFEYEISKSGHERVMQGGRWIPLVFSLFFVHHLLTILPVSELLHALLHRARTLGSAPSHCRQKGLPHPSDIPRLIHPRRARSRAHSNST